MSSIPNKMETRPAIGEGAALGAGVVCVIFLLALFVMAPLAALLVKSVQDKAGEWVGLANYRSFLASPALAGSALNSLGIAFLSTAITIALAFPYAYGLTRTRMKGAGLFKLAAQIPILAPSLLPAIALVYLFGNKGILKDWLMGHSIYGPIGIVMGEVFYTFPHAVMILVVALSTADARLYEAATSLGAGPWRRFVTITLPGARYGLISAIFVVFTLVITDFGVPKVIGGNYAVLATDVYKQVIGQQNFGMGAVVGMALLLPAVLAFCAESWGAARQKALLSSRSVPYRPERHGPTDAVFTFFCALVGLALLAILGMAAFASLVKFWPYDLSLSFTNYDFARFDPEGWGSYWNSLTLAGLTAIAGTAIIFPGAYLIEKTPGLAALKAAARFMAIVPLAVPGMVLGLSYIFFFNHPANPLGGLYATMAILVANTIAHFYTVSHLTAATALKQLDPEFEAVSASLKVPAPRTFLLVTVPLCLPAVLDIAIYLFVNAMTTVSAVVFLYAPGTKTASIAVLAMDDAGEVAGAAAMAMVIVASSAMVRLAHAGLARMLARRSQGWRRA